MKTNNIKTTALLIGCSLALTSMLTNAAPQITAQRHQMQTIARQQPVHYPKNWNLGLKKNLKINKDQAITLTRAALIMQDHKHIHTGTVTTIVRKNGHQAYLITLQNKNNKIIQRVIVNAQNGTIKPFKIKQQKLYRHNIKKKT